MDRLDDGKRDERYKKVGVEVFLGMFMGYGGYYLVGKNLGFGIGYVEEEGLRKSELGFVVAGVWIGYGFSKLIMGMM